MGNFIKALCLTLLFFAYSFGLLGSGMLVEKRILDAKTAEEAVEQQKIDAAENKTAVEYHKYYEIVVSRIKASELEGLNKDAIKEYIAGYQERFDKLADLFYPDRDKNPDSYGSNFPMMYAAFVKAFDENEISMYKSLILSTTMAVSNEDVEIIFKDPMEGLGTLNTAVNNPPAENYTESNTEAQGENPDTENTTEQ